MTAAARGRRGLQCAFAAVLAAAIVNGYCTWQVSSVPAAALLASGAEPRAEVGPAAADVGGELGADRLPAHDEARAPVLVDVVRPVEAADVWRWTDDLRDDDRAGNAEAACARLAELPPGRVPHLELALASNDAQQRHLAAAVLRRRCECSGIAPSPELLRVSVEALSREVCDHLRRTHERDVGAASARFLAPRAAEARESLRAGLGSRDEQQRFLCAYLLAAGGEKVDAARLARELVARLGDNGVAGDALMAVHGLHTLGEDALPTLRLWRAHLDPQARALADLVELDLREPPRGPQALRARRRLHSVTKLYHDPAVEFDLRRSVVATWSTPRR